MAKEQVFYRKNVNYNVGVRMYPKDSDGVVLTGAEPFVAVPVEDLREFKQANKRILIEGLLIPTSEPSVEWETDNALGDEEIDALVKNYLQLKSKLPKISSLPIIYKLLETAKSQDRAKRIISMIQARIDELEEEDTFSASRDEQGVE